MKTIVALVDFSDVTFKLLRQAHDLAKAFDGQVVLLHVVPPQPVVVDVGIAPTIYRTPSAELVEADREKLTALQDSLTKFGVRTSALQLQVSHVSELLEECRRVQADMIIVGTHGHGSFYELLVGSITAAVLKKAPCPVLVVPQSTVPSSAPVEAEAEVH